MKAAFLTLSTALFCTSFALAAPDVIVPPPGLYCCPDTGPNGWDLIERHIGPFFISCVYGNGDESQECLFDPARGVGATIPGCPSQAVPNPDPPNCPV
ncbi:hypothetical protein AGABI2DRAFT_153040 [Agaricus bisporus var. bisporus H97]|uniref:hypothetical protein n=1 Tax=Agaricus bisporus var. bisporus (strain H97 / ATCC MYA-4626 / FGSC 10389) TaxID=936046 RepID=UPI00029F68D7|nr:hypothetical protein AGABI2DRAFT_153040 [Agaricus bisporus var. bisporus H97]EKV44732.1 hypothetical protein AGABI2DRAFT_153040 [Agaricus bisporus var. bisporus H97]